MKCDHSPSRVPGSAKDSRSWPSASRQVIGGVACAPIGESRTHTSTATPTSRPIPAAPTYADVQPYVCSTKTSGIVAATWPSCPSRPVTWVRIGTRLAGNHDGISRSTLTKVIASPVPTSMRATIAPPADVVRAMYTCPPAMTSAPSAIIRREPIRSTSTPTGTCMTAYMTSCSTANTENSDAPIPKRAVAYSAATLSEERWNTASPYARTPTPHTSQAREGKRTCLILAPPARGAVDGDEQ